MANTVIDNERILFMCGCGSNEHWFCVGKISDEDYEEYYIEAHLSTHRNFFQRLWYGVKYAFGYKSKFGAWDSVMLDRNDIDKLAKFLQKCG